MESSGSPGALLIIWLFWADVVRLEARMDPTQTVTVHFDPFTCNEIRIEIFFRLAILMLIFFIFVSITVSAVASFLANTRSVQVCSPEMYYLV